MLHEDARQEQAKNRNTPEYFAALRLRKIWCEGNFSHQKAEHNLRQTYKRGIERVTGQCLLSVCAMNLIRLVKAANAAFFHCLGVIFQGLFHLGVFVNSTVLRRPLYYRNCSQKTVLYGIDSLPKYRKLSKMSMIFTRTSDLLGSALRIIGGSFGQILFCRVLFPAITRA